MSQKILILDDDVRLRDLLRRYLSEQGYSVEAADTAERLRTLLLRERFDLIVLDVMMPVEDGLTVLRKLRAAGDLTPVIMLTAMAQEEDRISGLELGADDYLAKPFNPRELNARIRSVLRRAPELPLPGAPSETQATVHFGRYALDLSRRTLHLDGAALDMTAGEFSVLKVLTEHANKTLSREKLMELSRGRALEAFDRSLDVQVSRLRKLLAQDEPANPQYVQTVRGVGYVFIAQP